MNRRNPMMTMFWVLLAFFGTMLVLALPVNNIRGTGSPTLDLIIWAVIAVGTYECWAYLIPYYVPSPIIRPLRKWRRKRREAVMITNVRGPGYLNPKAAHRSPKKRRRAKR